MSRDYKALAKYGEIVREARNAVDEYERYRYADLRFDQHTATETYVPAYHIAFRSERAARSALKFLEIAPRLISELQAAVRFVLLEEGPKQ